jgi:hypothetical protein
MNKILAHVCNQRIYFPLLQQLNQKIDIINGSLHGNIFDAYHKYQPNTVILPIYEYTQEFHEFVDTFKDKINIVIFMGDIVHKDLTEYCHKFNIKTIKQGETYEYIYDSTVFVDLKTQRNDKILTILHNDNTINHQLLDDILYPKSNTKIVLINNPQFNHPQNIGLANSADMAVLLNKFEYVLDLTQSYSLEAQSCGIKNISLNGNLIDNIKELNLISLKDNIQQYSMENFINNKLLKLIEA